MAWHRCEKCGKKFAFQKSLIEHQIQAKHNPTSRGQPLTSGQIQQAVRHPEVLRCKQCSYEAVGSTVDLELHIRLQHASGAQPSTNGARSTKSNNNSGYKCNKCRKMFDSLPTLIRHKEIFHPPEAQYALQLKPTGNTNFPKSKSGLKCRLCGKAFPTPFSFEQHLIKKHRSPSAASATSVISCSRSTSGGSRSGGSGTATSPDSCTGAAPPPPMLNRTAAVPLRTTKERRRLLENHRCRTQIVSQNYGPALTNKATEFPVIYRVKKFKLGRSLVIIRVASH